MGVFTRSFHHHALFLPQNRNSGVCPKLIAARKRQLHHDPALSQWHFIVVFWQFRQKPGFFMQNVFQKGLQRPFWLSLHYVA